MAGNAGSFDDIARCLGRRPMIHGVAICAGQSRTEMAIQQTIRGYRGARCDEQADGQDYFDNRVHRELLVRLGKSKLTSIMFAVLHGVRDRMRRTLCALRNTGRLRHRGPGAYRDRYCTARPGP